NFAVYDPTLDAWTPLGAMPTPVNHAAAGTDGTRMYVFGGRQGNNVPQPGFDDVQIYDPIADSWETSDAGDVAAMPLPRGGTGRAAWLDGAFWIMGGEDASVAYEDVQVYDPVADTWRTDAPMKTPRHGIFPTVFQGRIYVLGGGLVAGFGVSAVSEVLAPR
ncbi:MAG: kelch repeat-containing protein, partial [Planctomycetota bacterium]